MLKEHQDAFGREMYDYYQGNRRHVAIIERDDGYIDGAGEPEEYFGSYRKWAPLERKAIRYARGRVLDIGCGAGRHALYLQERGLEITGIDNSPLAVEVCRWRGLKDVRVLPVNGITAKLGIFDTVLMMGNNFGLFGSFQGARRLLGKMSKLTSARSRIIATSGGYRDTTIAEHLDYQKLNRSRGRMGGQLRLRVRYMKYATPWFDYLRVSKDEMEDILDGTDWEVGKYIDSDTPLYAAIINKKG